MSDKRRVHNPNAYAVIYNSSGNNLDGCSGIETDVDDAVTAKLLGDGRLVLAAEPMPELERPVPVPVQRTRSKSKIKDATPDAGTNLGENE